MDVQATTGNKSLRFLGYGILTLASLVGIWAIVIRLREGLIVTNMTQLVPWGFWIAFYIYFIGLSAGSFLLSTLVYVFGVKRFEAVGPLALFQALACLLMGMFLIFIDLGHPERFLNVFIHWNWTSVLAWESLFYVFYTIIILAELYYVLRPALARRARTGTSLNWLYRLLARGDQDPGPEWRERASRRMRILGLIGIPVAIGVHGGTGAIFAVVKSRPTWYTGLFPIIFLVSALASGGALLTFLAAATSKFHAAKKLELVRGLARLTVAVLAFDLLLEFSEILVVFYGGIPRHITGWHNILFGPFWWMFWFVQLLMGALVPIGLVLHEKTGASIRWLGTAGLLIVLGIVGVRLNIVIPAQIEPAFPSLPEVYHHARFTPGYFPSLNEWLVGLGSVSLGIWGFLLCLRIFPITETPAALEAASVTEAGAAHEPAGSSEEEVYA